MFSKNRVCDTFIMPKVNISSLPISCRLSLSISPENIRKPEVFLFSGGMERDLWHEVV